MNQSERVDTLRRCGWHPSHTSLCGFVHLWKRDTRPDRNYVMPDYFDVTIFPNGRVAEGDYKKYPKGAGKTRRSNINP